jgi:hypothetical protein
MPWRAPRSGPPVVDAVLDIAEEIGRSPVQVSLAWLRGRAAAAATALIPIVDPDRPGQGHVTGRCVRQYLSVLCIILLGVGAG